FVLTQSGDELRVEDGATHDSPVRRPSGLLPKDAGRLDAARVCVERQDGLRAEHVEAERMNPGAATYVEYGLARDRLAPEPLLYVLQRAAHGVLRHCLDVRLPVLAEREGYRLF